MSRRGALRVALQFVPLVAFLALWQWYGSSSDRRRFYYATPELVWRALADGVADGSLPENLAVTAGEALAGFVAGNVIGATFGLGLWFWPAAARFARPYLLVLGVVPVFALAPLTILWFGVGVEAKAALAFLATVFVAAAQAHRGAEQVDPLHLQRLRVFGATRRQVFRWLLLPSASIWVLSSFRLTSGAALLGALLGEFIVAERGIGYMIVKAAGLYDTPRVLVGILLIVGIALVVDALVDLFEREFLSWRPPTSTAPSPSA